MSLLDFFEKRDSLKAKILLIKRDMKKLVSETCGESITVLWYGTYDINPTNLVYWITIETDQMKKLLKSNIELNKDLRKLLIKYDYPENARDGVAIEFESQETVDRESEGDWHLHFQ